MYTIIMSKEKISNVDAYKVLAQKIAQMQDTGQPWSSSESKPKDEVLNINNYVRYWDESTPNGHQIRIAKTDGSKLTINLEWPKGHNPRIRQVKLRQVK